MCMRLVVCAKQQKPMVRLPGPLLRLAARVVRTCLVRHSLVPSLQDKTACRSTNYLTSYRLCSRGCTVITNLETPLVLLAWCPVATFCQLHGIRLRHAAVGPMFAWWSRTCGKADFPRVDRHSNALATAEATPCRIYRNPVGKYHGPRHRGSYRRLPRRKMAVLKIFPDGEEKELQ